jgi:hypothetical protein
MDAAADKGHASLVPGNSARTSRTGGRAVSCVISRKVQSGGVKKYSHRNILPAEGILPSRDQSDGVLHAQTDIRDDLFRGVGGCQRCQCSGNSPWCPGWCRGWRSSSRAGRCDCGRFCGSGDRHRRRDSWRSPGHSCSRCEDVHRFRPHDHGTKSSRGEEVREVSTLRDLIWSEPGGRQVRERHLATGDAASTFS